MQNPTSVLSYVTVYCVNKKLENLNNALNNDFSS